MSAAVALEVARRLVPNDDMLGEVIPTLLLCLERHDPARSALETYVTKMVRWKVASVMRREAHRERLVSGLRINFGPDLTPEHLCGAKRRAQAVWRALAALPDAERRAVAGLDLAERSGAEMAASMGLSRSQVYRHRRRGLQLMRELLIEQGVMS